MPKKNLQDAPLVRSTLKIDLTKEVQSDLANKKPIIEKIAPYLTGLVSFLVGLILFIPLDDLVVESMSKVNLGKRNPQADSVSISIFGNLELDNLILPLPSMSDTPTDTQNVLKSSLIEGDVSLISFLLFNTLNIKLNIKNFTLDFFLDAPFSLSGEKIQIIFEGDGLKNGITAGTGKLQFNGVDLLGNYDGIIPGVGEKLGSFLVSNIIGEMNLKSGVLSIKDFRIESNLVEIKATGTLHTLNSARSRLSFTIEPSGIIRKYAENNFEVLLKSMGLLHSDGKMFYECQKGLSICNFRKVNTDTNQSIQQ